MDGCPYSRALAKEQFSILACFWFVMILDHDKVMDRRVFVDIEEKTRENEENQEYGLALIASDGSLKEI